MKTIKDIYKIGVGPSSSHTMGPQKAAFTFNSRFPNAASFEVTLYGSLAATGKGHMTDKAILDTLQAPTEIVWKPDVILPFHPNGMLFKAFDAEKNLLGDWQVFSIGGGNLAEEGKLDESPEVYPLSKMTDILNWCEHSGRTYWEYVYQYENQKEIEDYMMEVWRVMKAAVERGIQAEGVLPGPLNLSRKAATYHIKASGYTHTLKSRGLVYSYALAVSEENASGGIIVTAPTCGSCGVMPAVLYHLSKSYEFADQRIVRALVTAGLVGNIVRTNASISGAEVVLQGHLSGIFYLGRTASKQLVGGSGSHGAGHTYFTLTSYLGSRDGGDGAHDVAYQARCHQGAHDAQVGKLIALGEVIEHRGHHAARSAGRGRDDASTRSVFF